MARQDAEVGRGKWEFFDCGFTGRSAEGLGHSVEAEGKGQVAKGMAQRAEGIGHGTNSMKI
jgi:hypothetical protein